MALVRPANQVVVKVLVVAAERPKRLVLTLGAQEEEVDASEVAKAASLLGEAPAALVVKEAAGAVVD